jgi:NTP pyrophosphatase (non-canonical NTP hydrolase)
MTLDEYQQKALKTVVPTADNLSYTILGLASEAGEAAGKLKKWMRDQDSDLKKLDRQAFASELGDALWYIAVAAHKLGFTLDEVANQNADKLANRYDRGKISGSGDTR